MTHTVAIKLPEDPPVSLKESPKHSAAELKMLAAVKLFGLERLSSGRAVQPAGISGVELLMRIGGCQVSPYSPGLEDLREDMANAWMPVISRNSP